MRIENGVAIPAVARTAKARKSKYPFARMNVGQSASEILPRKEKEAARIKANVLSALARATTPTVKFTTRTMMDEKGRRVFRVWRIPVAGVG